MAPERGMTLVEMLLTMTMLAFVLAAVVTFLVTTRSVAARGAEAGTAQATAAVGYQRMVREIRQAVCINVTSDITTANCGGATVGAANTNPIPCAAATTAYCISFKMRSITASDHHRIDVRYDCSSGVTTTTGAMTTSSSSVGVTSATGITAGHAVALDTGANAETLQVSSVSGNTLTFNTNASVAHAAGTRLALAECTRTQDDQGAQTTTPIIPLRASGLGVLNTGAQAAACTSLTPSAIFTYYVLASSQWTCTTTPTSAARVDISVSIAAQGERARRGAQRRAITTTTAVELRNIV